MFIYGKKQHPHFGATYEILEQDGGYAVQVHFPQAAPATIRSLASRTDAERWIERHRAEVARGAPERRSFNSRQRSGEISER